MRQSKNKRNIVVVSHKVVHQPDDDLVQYLNNKSYENVLHIMHSFANAPDRKSKYVWYKKGKIYKENETRDYRLYAEPILYGKELYSTFQWITQSRLKWDLYIGLDGLCVFFGNILRSLGMVKQTIFWAIDFVPHDRFNDGIKNKLYRSINKMSTLHVDEMWDLSPRMLEGREKYSQIRKADYKQHHVVQYGLWLDRIKPISYADCQKNAIVFMGNLSKYQGLQLIVSALPTLIKIHPQIKLQIIGEGDYTDEIKRLAQKLNVSKYCEFMGRMRDTVQMEKKIANAAIAIAPYLHEMDNISRYADPGKVKTYLACGVPVLLTDIPWNAHDIEKNKCGMIISESEKDIVKKITYLLQPKVNSAYRKNALTYAENFNFRKIFDNVSL